MDFIAIDFETANPKRAACAIGFVLVKNDVIVDEYYSLINPEQPFSANTIAVHGITKKAVADSPRFPEVWAKLEPYFRRYPVVAHNVAFDKSVLERALHRYHLSSTNLAYYDTMKLYQYNFPGAGSCNLKAVCAALGVSLEHHHNALADATAAANVMLALLRNTGNAIFPSDIGNEFSGSPTEDAERKNMEYTFTQAPKLEPTLETTTATIDIVDRIAFEGSTFVITGMICGYDRDTIEERIRSLGGQVAGSVSRKTNYVVTGLQNTSLIKDAEGVKSAKILRAEALRSEGYHVKIIGSDALLAALHDETQKKEPSPV